MARFQSLKYTFILTAFLTLAACDSAEERAEAHYQSGLELLEEGDVDRAIVEFRNVFEYNSNHRDARATLADIFLARGSTQSAYSEYLRLAEQYPDDLAARQTLAEIAFSARNWDELERHGARAETLAPEDTRVKVITLARMYRTAALATDTPTRRDIASQAQDIRPDLPDSPILHNMITDSYIRDQEFAAALAELDDWIARVPQDLTLYNQRLSVIAAMEDPNQIEAAILEMVDLFPEEQELKTNLLRFYISRGESEKAEAFLASISDPTDPDPAAYLAYVNFISETRGAEAAATALDEAIAVNPNPKIYQALRATLTYQQGDREAAVATLEGLLLEAEPNDETHGIKVTLARFLIGMDNQVGAQQQIAEVIAADPSHVNALKIQAGWQIDGDETDEAIAGLRTALDKAPEDVEAMTLMARAYQRAGSPELARDFLALAADVSLNDPAPVMRYARVLIDEERYLAAEDILLPALRRTPQNIDILNMLGQLYIGMEDYGRAEQAITALRNLETPEATQLANTLNISRLNAQQGLGEAVAFIESQAGENDGNLNAQLTLLQARLQTGRFDDAVTIAQELSATDPADEQRRAILATTLAATGDHASAADIYRALLDAGPNRPQLWARLSRSLALSGDTDGARQAIEDGIAAVPGDATLLWALASFLEQEGDIDSAIDIYEELYALSSNSVIVANNLASLLATYRDDPQSLERARVVSRRLSGTDVAPFQDTYGWILHRSGESQEAVSYLENAAAALQADAIVQYHLGAVYAAVGRNADAIAQLEHAIEVAGPIDQRPQFDTARALITQLQAQPETTE